MAGYTKLFSSILASTVWREDDKTRIVWITLMAMADRRGVAEGSVPGLADFARVSVDDCRMALDKLMSPDSDSRSDEHDGRRIRAVPGGWLLLNHAKYREKMNADDRREYLRQKKAEQRARERAAQQRSTRSQQMSPNVPRSPHRQHIAEAEADHDRGSSLNPDPDPSKIELRTRTTRARENAAEPEPAWMGRRDWHGRCPTLTSEACKRGICVPGKLAAEWMAQMGDRAELYLPNFISVALLQYPPETPIPGDPFTFWRTEWARKHPVTAPAPPGRTDVTTHNLRGLREDIARWGGAEGFAGGIAAVERFRGR